MNEVELLAEIIPKLPVNDDVLTGAGDDCAVLAVPSSTHDLLLKTDAVVEGVHFTMETDPALVGRKSLARCLSDIAAMCGKPSTALIGMGLPPNFNADYVRRFYKGFTDLALAYGCSVSGGETVASSQGYWFSITLTGWVCHGKAVLRRGAQVGDALFVTGALGGSLFGKHLRFDPRVREALWLAERFDIHSMIDLSDGLAKDLPHLLDSSRVGAEILHESVPLSAEARAHAKETHGGIDGARRSAWNDGEDFELLFTIAPSDAVQLLDTFREAFPMTQLTCIGRITQDKKLRVKSKNGSDFNVGHGYIHFQKP